MNKDCITVALGAVVLATLLCFVIYIRGNTIEKLNLKLDANAIEIGGYKDDIKELKNTLTKQNIQIDALKLNVETSEKALKEQRPIIEEKWQTITKTIYVTNSTCEQKLKESDEIDRRFFDEHQNKKQ